MRRNTFSVQGGGVYRCETCGRPTRHTGTQSMGSRLCPQCWELAGIVNEISDGHATLEEKRTEADALLAAIRSRGGKPELEFEELC